MADLAHFGGDDPGLTLGWTRRELVVRVQLGAALTGCAVFPMALLALRTQLTDELSYSFLAWNLFLAGVPVAFALATDAAWRLHRRVTAAVAGGLWLLFFPNAPYLITDLIHLRSRPPAPIWFDALILVSAGVAGLLAGFASLRIVHLILDEAVGRTWAWAVALGVLALSGFGVYLGRFARLNSWDVLTRPRSLLYRVPSAAAGPMVGARVVGITVVFAGFLVVSYLTMVCFSNLGRTSRRPCGSSR